MMLVYHYGDIDREEREIGHTNGYVVGCRYT